MACMVFSSTTFLFLFLPALLLLYFIGKDIRLEQVTLHKGDEVEKLLAYYMGKNTMERQNFIIDNLVIEEDIPEEEQVYD